MNVHKRHPGQIATECDTCSRYTTETKKRIKLKLMQHQCFVGQFRYMKRSRIVESLSHYVICHMLIMKFS